MDFLDITVTIEHDNIQTTLFEKSLNLYLYIPPHSAHPPGVLAGLVIGNCHRIFTLCSDDNNKYSHLRQFFTRLKARGYTSDVLLPLFHRAHLLATNPPTKEIPPSRDNILKSRIFFHLEYHPDSISSREIQEVWLQTVMQHSNAPHLSLVTSFHNFEVEIRQMTVAYSRARNLGNLLSSRNLHLSTGPQVSFYRK